MGWQGDRTRSGQTLEILSTKSQQNKYQHSQQQRISSRNWKNFPRKIAMPLLKNLVERACIASQRKGNVSTSRSKSDAVRRTADGKSQSRPTIKMESLKESHSYSTIQTKSSTASGSSPRLISPRTLVNR